MHGLALLTFVFVSKMRSNSENPVAKEIISVISTAIPGYNGIRGIELVDHAAIEAVSYFLVPDIPVALADFMRTTKLRLLKKWSRIINHRVSLISRIIEKFIP